VTDPLQDPGVQGLAQLGRNAIERVAQLEAELAGYVEANRHMKGELDDALEDARKYAEAQREIVRMREALVAIRDSQLGPDRGSAQWELTLCMSVAHDALARAPHGQEPPK